MVILPPSIVTLLLVSCLCHINPDALRNRHDVDRDAIDETATLLGTYQRRQISAGKLARAAPKHTTHKLPAATHIIARRRWSRRTASTPTPPLSTPIELDIAINLHAGVTGDVDGAVAHAMCNLAPSNNLVPRMAVTT
eukprot:scaffold9377_cov109-Skeletonema_dohrnii-CCMP3373.AAC.1